MRKRVFYRILFSFKHTENTDLYKKPCHNEGPRDALVNVATAKYPIWKGCNWLMTLKYKVIAAVK